MKHDLDEGWGLLGIQREVRNSKGIWLGLGRNGLYSTVQGRDSFSTITLPVFDPHYSVFSFHCVISHLLYPTQCAFFLLCPLRAGKTDMGNGNIDLIQQSPSLPFPSPSPIFFIFFLEGGGVVPPTLASSHVSHTFAPSMELLFSISAMHCLRLLRLCFIRTFGHVPFCFINSIHRFHTTCFTPLRRAPSFFLSHWRANETLFDFYDEFAVFFEDQGEWELVFYGWYI